MPVSRLLRGLIANRRRLAASGTGKPADQDHSIRSEDFDGVRGTLEHLLTENIIPFWYPGVIDAADGGYRLNHDVDGRWKGPANKRIVTQARTLWFFARLARSPYGSPLHLEAARHGYRFLCERMWDDRFGGFYWEVDSPGLVATIARKDVTGQSFALFALAEFAMASGDTSVADLARQLFGLCERHAHDDQHGGYWRTFEQDWNPPPQDPGLKLMNTHLHLLEAFTTYYLATSDPLARERLIELILVQSNAVVRKQHGACTERHRRDWTPLDEEQDARVSYGHDLENLWLLADAASVAGLSNGPLLDLYRTIFDSAWRYGFDHDLGGFFESGPIGGAADRRTKVWWVQAEALLSALMLSRLTNCERHVECFRRTLDWIVTRQADWAHGDWHAEITPDGKSRGDKAGAWKSPYHNGRAVLRCVELLSPTTEAPV